MRQPGAPNAIKFTNRGNCGNCVNGGPRSQHAAHRFGEAGVPLDEAAAALLNFALLGRPQRAKVAPKYRHRVTGATWTGRGKQPKWFAAAEQSELEHLSGDLA